MGAPVRLAGEGPLYPCLGLSARVVVAYNAGRAPYVFDVATLLGPVGLDALRARAVAPEALAYSASDDEADEDDEDDEWDTDEDGSAAASGDSWETTTDDGESWASDEEM